MGRREGYVTKTQKENDNNKQRITSGGQHFPWARDGTEPTYICIHTDRNLFAAWNFVATETVSFCGFENSMISIGHKLGA